MRSLGRLSKLIFILLFFGLGGASAATSISDLIANGGVVPGGTDGIGQMINRINDANRRKTCSQLVAVPAAATATATGATRLPGMKAAFLPRNKQDDARRCMQYIAPDGSYGDPKGQFFAAMLTTTNAPKNDLPKFAKLYTAKPTPDMPAICPGFAKFSNAQKTHFWVWFWMALAMDESSCGYPPDLRGDGAHAGDGDDIGEFQMEESKEFRHAGARPDPECFPADDDMMNFKNNATCAFAIFYKEVNSGIPLFGANHYWKKLRGDAGNVESVVRKYPGCGNK